MGKAELTIFIVLVNVILLIFITGIVVFIFQYRKRKLLHEKEKAAIEKQHKLDLLNNQVQIQQQTMQFIGSEIHDSVAQKLTLAAIYSQKLEYENKQPSVSDNIGKISSIINDSLTELRDLARTLTNTGLQESTLVELLKTECAWINEAGVCRVDISHSFTATISVKVKSALLRVMQEFLQNSLKHSGCDLVSINMQDKAGGLCILLSDNGKGFDADKIVARGIGLNNMRRRIEQAGGQFHLESSPGNGTRLELFIDHKNLLTE